MHWDEMSEVQDSLDTIVEDLKKFEESFEDNFFYSDKDKMSDQFSRLRDMLGEFKDEVEYTKKNVIKYYE